MPDVVIAVVLIVVVPEIVKLLIFETTPPKEAFPLILNESAPLSDIVETKFTVDAARVGLEPKVTAPV